MILLLINVKYIFSGRLNVLANVCRKPLHQLFTQFAGLEAEDDVSLYRFSEISLFKLKSSIICFTDLTKVNKKLQFFF